MECRFVDGSIPRIPQTVTEIPGLAPSPFLGQGLDCNIGNDIDFDSILDDLISNDILDIGTSAPAWDNINLVRFELPPPPLQEPTVHDVSGILAGKFEPPWSPGHFLFSRFFQHEEQPVFRPSVASLTERLMKTALRSYPNMMRPDSMPPFIHPTHVTHEDMRTTLDNCVSLVLLWKSQREFNKRFVEESLKRERNRLYGEV